MGNKKDTYCRRNNRGKSRKQERIELLSLHGFNRIFFILASTQERQRKREGDKIEREIKETLFFN